MCGDDGLVADKEKDKLSCSNKEGQECYTCKDGDCGNHCDASGAKISKEFFYDVTDFANKWSARISSNPFLNVHLGTAKASFTQESGEECCTDCRIASKGEYDEYTGSFSMDARIIGVVPGTGAAIVVTPVIVAGYRVSGLIEVGLYGEISGKANGGLSGKLSDCGEACIRLKSNLGAAGALGIKAELGAKFEDCDKIVAKKCIKPTTLLSASAKVDSSVFASVRVNSDQGILGECPHGKNCLEVGLSEGNYQFSTDVALEVFGIYKFSHNFSRKIKLWDKIQEGGCL